MSWIHWYNKVGLVQSYVYKCRHKWCYGNVDQMARNVGEEPFKKQPYKGM